ncbi:MAG: nitroreductase family protein, partial [Clostridia bacterium]|nr:nitroreductase family protein [Clostridia bacterium]
MNKDFYTAIKDRRSIYNISKEEVVSKEKIQELVNHAVMHTPSAFNSQSSRVVILFGENHDVLWDITKETLRKLVPEHKFAATEEKMNSFRNGYGTILFLNDKSVVEGLQQRFPKYHDNFAIWA